MSCPLVAAGLLFSAALFASDAASFRAISIPPEEASLGLYETRVIRSDGELSDLLKRAESDRWSNNQGAIEAIRGAQIDFSLEAVVFLCHEEPSGSIEVSRGDPRVEARKLICPLTRKVPGENEAQTDDMAEYCFVFVVNKSSIDVIELAVEGCKPRSFSIAPPSQLYRRITIPERASAKICEQTFLIWDEHSLNNFEKAVAGKESDPETKAAILKAFRASNVDFNHEGIVVWLHRERSSSVQVTLDTPKIAGRTIRFLVSRVVPAERSDEIMTQYCYVFVLERSSFDHIEYPYEGDKFITIR
jgi:hypothetical protein